MKRGLTPLEEMIYIADTGNNQVLLTKLPTSGPAPAWSAMKQHLLASDIDGAIPYFALASAEKYRQTFLSIGATDLASIMLQTPAIIPVYVESENAQYRFEQIIGGRTLSFPIEFMKENGIWKILEY